MEHKRFDVQGMSCAACEAAVVRSVSKVEGVDDVAVNLLAGTMDVDYQEDMTGEDSIIEAVRDAGYSAQARGAKKQKASAAEEADRRYAAEAKNFKIRLGVSIPFLVILMYFSMGTMFGAPLPAFMKGIPGGGAFALTQLLLTLPILIVNRSYFTRGFKSLFKGQPNMDALIAVGSAASFIYGVFALYRIVYGLGFDDLEIAETYLHDLYFESSATILTLITLGKFLEFKAKSRTSDSIRKLMDLQPKSARVLRNGKEYEVAVEDLAVGDIIVIRPGESIPVDGVILEGQTALDESALTGESIPVAKGEGDEVISATINKTGTISFRATKVGDDTTLAKIIALVEDANAGKAPIQSLADKIAAVFVPVVMIIAAVTFIVWLAAGHGFEFALRLGISVLVISCPCALGLATPVAIMAGTGKGAENNVLIKSAEALERLHEADTLIFDKTGTITEGKPFVTDLLSLETIRPETLLHLAASAEQRSEQPLASAILDAAAEKNMNLYELKSFEAVPGMGIRAEISVDEENVQITAGNRQLMEHDAVDCTAAEDAARRLAAEGKTPMYFARNGVFIGLIAAADIVKNNSAEALEKMRQAGLKTVMLTGDNERTAAAMASKLPIDAYYAEVLPQDKDAVVSSLQAEGESVVMVGDGINDAPALTRADVGMAIGAGTDVAMESADVVLVRSDLMDVLTAFRLSERTIRTIKENLFWAFFYNVINIPLAAGVLYPLWNITLNPMIAAFAMSMSSLFVVLNALRLNRFKAEEGTAYEPAGKRGLEIRTGLLPQRDNDNKRQESGRTAFAEEKKAAPAEKDKKKETISVQKRIYVDGMMCAHCQNHVKKALEALDGVKTAEVSLEEGYADVSLKEDLPDERFREAIQEAGYTPGKIEVI